LWQSINRGGGLFGVSKQIADHWLNTQFGWLPFLSDLRNFYKLCKSLDTRLSQLRRDNGQWIRRGGSVVKSESEETIYQNSNVIGLWPAVATQLYTIPNYGFQIVTRRNEQRVWFRGSFRYWIPGNPDSWEWKARAVSMLFGLRPDPSLLWELTPWSWLVDWCSNVGDVISNIASTSLDRLVAKYAYVMGTTTQVVTSLGMSSYSTKAIAESWTAALQRKSRVEASPFGFGLTGSDFTSRQWSILAALGLTRLR